MSPNGRGYTYVRFRPAGLPGDALPKQNRPIVRDGRIQQPVRKRTDRSYLGGTAAAPTKVATPPDEVLENPADLPEDLGAEPDAIADVVDAVEAAAPAGTAAAAAAAVPNSVRATERQGQRRRRDIDLDELGRADTRYALHELRRIAILAAIAIVTLIVLAVVLR